jgi:hypothetical protein
MYLYIVFFVLSASVMRGRTVYRETERKETRGGRKEKRGEEEEGREKGEAKRYDMSVQQEEVN